MYVCIWNGHNIEQKKESYSWRIVLMEMVMVITVGIVRVTCSRGNKLFFISKTCP